MRGSSVEIVWIKPILYPNVHISAIREHSWAFAIPTFTKLMAGQSNNGTSRKHPVPIRTFLSPSGAPYTDKVRTLDILTDIHSADLHRAFDLDPTETFSRGQKWTDWKCTEKLEVEDPSRASSPLRKHHVRAHTGLNNGLGFAEDEVGSVLPADKKLSKASWTLTQSKQSCYSRK